LAFFDKLLGKKNGIIIYSSDTWGDCIDAKSFFAEHDIKVEYKNIADAKNRQELVNKYKRMAVPTIIIGSKIFLGFEQNKDEIIKILKI
jgi:glutaredoxin 3